MATLHAPERFNGTSSFRPPSTPSGTRLPFLAPSFARGISSRGIARRGWSLRKSIETTRSVTGNSPVNDRARRDIENQANELLKSADDEAGLQEAAAACFDPMSWSGMF